MINIMLEFAKAFKKLRLEDNLTQVELAKKLKISKSAVSMYENGAREPDFETLELIADFFNVDMNYLLGHQPTTIAACRENDNAVWTEDELQDIEDFKKYILSKRNKNDN